MPPVLPEDYQCIHRSGSPTLYIPRNLKGYRCAECHPNQSHRTCTSITPVPKKCQNDIGSCLGRRHLDDTKSIVFRCRPSSTDHECPTTLLVEPATTPMPARKVVRIFVFVHATSPATAVLPPLRTGPLHTPRELCTPAIPSLLLLREVCESLPGCETTESYNGVCAEIGYRERKVCKRECCRFERFETVKKFFWRCKEE